MKKKDIIIMVLSVIMIIFSYSLLCLCKDANAIKDGEQNLPLYKGLISHLIEENPLLTSGANYIAIDPNSFGIVSEQDKKILIDYLSKYNDNILLVNIKMLDDPIFKDENGNLKGIFISANEFKIHENKIICEYTAYKNSLDSVGYNVVATYHNGKWKVNYKIFVS